MTPEEETNEGKRLFSYVVQHDWGDAPNPYFGVCTSLLTCALSRMLRLMISIGVLIFLSLQTAQPYLSPFKIESASAEQQARFITVKYRSTPVDISHPRFKYLDTSRSSFVTGTWYDGSNSYMIIASPFGQSPA